MESKSEVIDQLLCVACLCVGRTLHTIADEKHQQFYLETLNEISLCNMPQTCPSICWECSALLAKAVAFREQVKDSYRILQTYTSESLREWLLTDVTRPPRLQLNHVEQISIMPKPIKSQTTTKNQNKSQNTHINHGEELLNQDEEHLNEEESNFNSINDSNGDDEKPEIQLLLFKEMKNEFNVDDIDIDPIPSDDDQDYLSNLKTRNKNNLKVNNEQNQEIEINKNIDTIHEEVIFPKEEMKIDWNCEERDSHQILMETNKDISLSPADIETEIQNLTRKNKKRKKLDQKMKHAKRGKGPKRKSADTKILTIELSYEEMMAERAKEGSKPSYVAAPYKCDTCIVGFHYNNSYKAHIDTKHASSLGDSVCPICKTVVASVDSFTAHYKRHMRRYECSMCQKRTTDLKVMQQHYYSTHEITLKQYICDLCGVVSNSIDAHRYHKDSHKARVQCPECDKTFSHRAGLMNHRLAVHELHNSFPCTLCDKVFRWKNSLSRHLEKHGDKGKQTSAAFCCECDISFASVSSYQRHIKVSLKHVTPDALRFICDHCKRHFADKTKLRDHIEEKHLHKTFTCHICLKVSKNRVGLDQHIRNVHKGRPNNKMCHHCGKGFPTKMQLESHIRTHTGERPFICELCPITFSQRSNLNKHNKQVHMNIKSKRCPLTKRRKNEKLDSETHPNNQYGINNRISNNMINNTNLNTSNVTVNTSHSNLNTSIDNNYY